MSGFLGRGNFEILGRTDTVALAVIDFLGVGATKPAGLAIGFIVVVFTRSALTSFGALDGSTS